MSHQDTESKPAENKATFEVIGKEVGPEGNEFIVKHHQSGNISRIVDTYSEMFPMWVGRILITAENEKWALTAAKATTGFATSIIGSPAESGIERSVSRKTPDGRVGVIIQIYHTSRGALKAQMISRIGQCILTCPTTAAFNALTKTVRKVKIGSSLRYFGDGFEKKDKIKDRNVWRIPVMEGEFIIENRFGVRKGVAGGNFLILSRDQKSGILAAEKAVEAIGKVNGAVLTFPGGICRSGSKIGSMNYKLPASTNHPFCPSLKNTLEKSLVPDGVSCVYEVVINGLSLKVVEEAMFQGIRAAIEVSGTVKITAANYGGKLGPYKTYLKDLLNLN